MNKIKSVFIVEPANQGWIIERLMSDISFELIKLGVSVGIGVSEKYNGQDVIFNSRFLTPFNHIDAKINSLFITHIDDKIKEFELKSVLGKFNSFVCMSTQDADFVSSIKLSRIGVVGIDLPPRDLNVRPIRLALFSACYKDGRKNEQWIFEHFKNKSNDYRQSFTFCFLGLGWESFCSCLADLDMNYEIYRYSRATPGEYDFYKEVLAGVDSLIYMGVDGGAMSVYDAVNAGIGVIAPNISYHRGLGETVSLFNDQSEFFVQLDRLQHRHKHSREMLQGRSVASYVRNLLAHWNSVASEFSTNDKEKSSNLDFFLEERTLALYRSNYKPLYFSRLRSALIRFLQSRFSK